MKKRAAKFESAGFRTILPDLYHGKSAAIGQVDEAKHLYSCTSTNHWCAALQHLLASADRRFCALLLVAAAAVTHAPCADLLFDSLLPCLIVYSFLQPTRCLSYVRPPTTFCRSAQLDRGAARPRGLYRVRHLHWFPHCRWYVTTPSLHPIPTPCHAIHSH